MNYFSNYARKFQEGGAAPEGGGDPMQQIIEMAMQAIQTQDGNLALQACQGLVELLQQGAGGGEAGGEAPQGEPVYRQGGRLIRRVQL